MPFSFSVLSHSDHVSAFRPESEPGASPSERDAATSSGKELGPSIVPGGNDFSRTSSPAAFRSQPLVSSFSTIHLEGEPNVAYQVNDPNSKAPQWAHATDAETGAPLPQGRYVQKNDKGQWIPAKAPQASAPGTAASDVTPVTLAGDPVSYVIKDPSNTRTPQPLYTQNADGVLKQTSKLGTYGGHGGVRLDDGLKGGKRPAKGLNEKMADALERLTNARRLLNAVGDDVRRDTASRNQAQREADRTLAIAQKARGDLDLATRAGKSKEEITSLQNVYSEALLSSATAASTLRTVNERLETSRRNLRAAARDVLLAERETLPPQ